MLQWIVLATCLHCPLELPLRKDLRPIWVSPSEDSGKGVWRNQVYWTVPRMPLALSAARKPLPLVDAHGSTTAEG